MRNLGRVAPSQPYFINPQLTTSMFTYFIHPINLSAMDAVLKMRMQEGAAGYGIYIMLLEMLRSMDSYSIRWDPAVIAWSIHESDQELLTRVVQNYGLFELSSEGQLSSPWLSSIMEQHETKRAKLSAAGKKSAAVKKERKEDVATSLAGGGQPGCNHVGDLTQQDNIKEIKEKKEITTLPTIVEGEEVDIFSDDFISRVGKAKTELFVPELHAMGLVGDSAHNYEVLITRAVKYRMTVDQFSVLNMATNGCAIGTPRFMALIASFKHCEQTNFVPSYPFEYFMSRIKTI